MQTTGDALADVPVAQLGGQGAFVKEVQLAVLDGRADLAVHSAKDLPVDDAARPGAGVRPRARRSPRRAGRVARSRTCRTGATVATGSVRRRAQLAWLRPDLTFCDLRGNMATRLERAREVGAGVLALAALERLGLTAQVAEVLDPRTLLPQVGQGALAVECRAGDRAVLELLAAVDDPVAHAAVRPSAPSRLRWAEGAPCRWERWPCPATARGRDSSHRRIPGQPRRTDPAAPQRLRDRRRTPRARHAASPASCSTTAAAVARRLGRVRPGPTAAPRR